MLLSKPSCVADRYLTYTVFHRPGVTTPYISVSCLVGQLLVENDFSPLPPERASALMQSGRNHISVRRLDARNLFRRQCFPEPIQTRSCALALRLVSVTRLDPPLAPAFPLNKSHLRIRLSNASCCAASFSGALDV